MESTADKTCRLLTRDVEQRRKARRQEKEQKHLRASYQGLSPHQVFLAQVHVKSLLCLLLVATIADITKWLTHSLLTHYSTVAVALMDATWKHVIMNSMKLVIPLHFIS